ncbi:unnamed protein product [Rotaria sordida]|uniref:Uncharacterized protein n=1 Tax=Rotaria sordida TaxID=392033 RepID=A0A814VSI3_9BILA|nr:unnamed protein product [Rotaria sordida]CAF1461157.1 unnamed protein product [Rotaria sordida]
MFAIVNSAKNAGHKFMIKKDVLSGVKSAEFSVYDENEQQLKYRIESHLLPVHNNEVFVYPSKKVIAKLKSKWASLTYSATISILDPQSNRWINGNITDIGGLSAYEYIIYWNGEFLSIKNPSSSYIKFYDKTERIYLARFQKQRALLKQSKYDLEVLSDKYPDALYLLGLTVWDHDYSRFNRGKK